MTLSEQQCDFLAMVAKLINELERNDIKVIEWYRSVEQEAKNIANGTSHLKRPEDCKHCVGLAVDLGIIKDGKLSLSRADYDDLGEAWESMGGFWGRRWTSFNNGDGDYFHFQYTGDNQ